MAPSIVLLWKGVPVFRDLSLYINIYLFYFDDFIEGYIFSLILALFAVYISFDLMG